jgi:hypothetical protein
MLITYTHTVLTHGIIECLPGIKGGPGRAGGLSDELMHLFLDARHEPIEVLLIVS